MSDNPKEPQPQPANNATVGYKGYLSTNGGSEMIEIVLPLGAPPEALRQAIEQWRAIRDEAQAALRATQRPPAPAEIILTFGKYQGRTLGAILASDVEYVRWLVDKAREPQVQQAARTLLNQQAQQRIWSRSPNDSLAEPGEEVPFSDG